MAGGGNYDWSNPNIMNDEAKRHARPFGNFSIPYFRPWGSQGATAAVAVLFSIWMILANMFLITLILTNRTIRRQRQAIFVLHIALADLAIGIFYCPLAADFYIKQIWNHGCEALFIWNTFLYLTAFISTHSIALMDVYRLLGTCCRMKMTACTKNVLTAVIVVLFWFYLVMIGAAMYNFRSDVFPVLVSPRVHCHATIDQSSAFLVAMTYMTPAALATVFFSVMLIREKCQGSHPHQELNRPEEPQLFTLPIIGAAHVVTLVMPLPYFIIVLSVSLGSCSSLGCISWVVPVTTVFEWLLFAKSGVQPCIWLLNADFRLAMLPFIRLIRRHPPADTTELVEADGDSTEDNDPFGEI